MKKLIITAMASLATLAALAQGTIELANISTAAGINAPIFQLGGTTKLSGANYQAQLLGGPSATSLVLQGSPIPFLTAGGAGYFSGVAVTVNNVAGGASGFFQVVAWDTTLGGTTTGATEAQALAAWQGGKGNVIGFSTPVLSITTGNPAGSPPTSPAFLTGLTSFSLAAPVPEPSTFALAGLGAAALMIFRRRK